MADADMRSELADLYNAALVAVAPGPALLRALADEPLADRVWLIAIGRAAASMAGAAVQHLSRFQRSPTGGLVVDVAVQPPPHPSITMLAGDHPEPGDRSLAAAASLDRLVEAVRPGDTVWVLLSGGATSLVGAPAPGVVASELAALYALLLRSGLDIKDMNRVRKRFTRWGAGRLAQSLRSARVRCYVVSDVIGDDLAAI